MISYKPLRKLLIDKDLSCGELKDILQISSATMAKLNSDKIVSLVVIDKICKYLNCNIQDVMQYENKKKEKK
ncbi:MAG: helix-turn-helix domain-containing protein [Clostridia bacterium]|nr:helix-turn-helix domain-containing protein [Clostridia bacterium]